MKTQIFAGVLIAFATAGAASITEDAGTVAEAEREGVFNTLATSACARPVSLPSEVVAGQDGSLQMDPVWVLVGVPQTAVSFDRTLTNLAQENC